MGKKVLIISTSLRANSNSETLAKEAERGAIEAGHEVEFVSLKGKTINFCKGCMACQNLGHCVIKDDACEIVEKMLKAEVIIWATPVYYYEMSGQMKTMIDRANPLFDLDYKFRDVYVIATAADSSRGVIKSIEHGINGWVDCFAKAKFAGSVEASGINNPLEVRQYPDIMMEAFNLGKSV